jgi:hypothetical protein
MVEIHGLGGYIEQRIDLRDRARDAQDAGHPDKEIGQLDLVGLQGLVRGAALPAAG